MSRSLTPETDVTPLGIWEVRTNLPNAPRTEGEIEVDDHESDLDSVRPELAWSHRGK